MHVPKLLTAAVLESLAAPDETHAVRIVVRANASSAPYTLRGIYHRYVVTRDAGMAAHVLDIPLSVWMHESPTGVFRKNPSLSFDLQAHRVATKSPIVILVVPWKHAKAGSITLLEIADQSARLAALHKLIKLFGAPPEVLDAVELVRSPGVSDAEVVSHIESLCTQLTALPEPDPKPAKKQVSAAAKRQRECRKRKQEAAKKASETSIV